MLRSMVGGAQEGEFSTVLFRDVKMAFFTAAILILCFNVGNAKKTE